MRIFFIAFVIFTYSFHLFSGDTLPGRVGNDGDYVVRVGECDIYFFMTEEKEKIINQFRDHINNDFLIKNIFADHPSKCYAPAVVAVGTPEEDPRGAKFLTDYLMKGKEIMEGHFGFDLLGISLEVNLYYNFESLVFHRDRFTNQYEWLSCLTPPIERYTLIQDLTVFDWQMGKGTVTGTVVQDGDFGDRYLFCVFQDEALGTLYTEPAVYLGPNIAPNYPGHVTIPYHTGIAPIDYNGERFCGTSRGKRLSTSIRGLVRSEEMKQVRENCQEVYLNKKQKIGSSTWRYQSGIIVHALTKPFPKLDVQYAILLPEKENITLLEIPASIGSQSLSLFSQAGCLPSSSLKKVLRLIKKDGGFSKFSELNLQLKDSERVLIVNHSAVPEGYRYFQLAQDFTKEHLPWIQFYHFSPSEIFEMDYKTFKHLSLSPVEELLYMNEAQESENYESEYKRYNTKLSTCIDVYFFED